MTFRSPANSGCVPGRPGRKLSHGDEWRRFGETEATKIPGLCAIGRPGRHPEWQTESGAAQLWGHNVLDRFYLLNVSHVTDSGSEDSR